MSPRGQKISPAVEPGFFLALRSLVQWQLSRYGFVKSVNVDRAGPGDNRKPQNLVCAGALTAPSGYLAGVGQASAGRREMWLDRRRRPRQTASMTASLIDLNVDCRVWARRVSTRITVAESPTKQKYPAAPVSDLRLRPGSGAGGQARAMVRTTDPGPVRTPVRPRSWQLRVGSRGPDWTGWQAQGRR